MTDLDKDGFLIVESKFVPDLMRPPEDLTEADFLRLGRRLYERAWKAKKRLERDDD